MDEMAGEPGNRSALPVDKVEGMGPRLVERQIEPGDHTFGPVEIAFALPGITPADKPRLCGRTGEQAQHPAPQVAVAAHGDEEPRPGTTARKKRDVLYPRIKQAAERRDMTGFVPAGGASRGHGGGMMEDSATYSPLAPTTFKRYCPAGTVGDATPSVVIAVAALSQVTLSAAST